MNKKLMVGDQQANKTYLLRTTEFILEAFSEEATKRGKGSSVNILINQTLLPKAKKLKEKNKK